MKKGEALTLTNIYSAKSVYLPVPVVAYDNIVPIMAFYQGNTMLRVEMDLDYTIGNDMLRLDMSDVTVPQRITSFKIMAWENMGNMKPLINAHTIE